MTNGTADDGPCARRIPHGHLIKTVQDTLAGTVCILVILVGLCWYARRAELEPGFASSADGESAEPLQVSVNHIDWSTDGQKLLSLSRGDVGPDGRLLLHDRSGGRLALQIDFADEPTLSTAAISPDGLHVVVGTMQGRLLWSGPESDAPWCLLELPHVGIAAVAVSPDGNQVAAGITDGRIYLCSPRAEAPGRMLSGPSGASSDVRFSSDGKRLVGTGSSGRVCVWDVMAETLEAEFRAHDRLAVAGAFLPDGQRIMTAGTDETLRIWDIAEAREEWVAHCEDFNISTFDLSPDGRLAAVGGRTHKLAVWDLERQRKTFEISAPLSIFQLKFSPDGSTIAVAGKDRWIRRYDARTGNELPGISVGPCL